MSSQARRAERNGYITALRSVPNAGSLRVVQDLLRLEIEEAHLEMEHADNEVIIWRAQGRAAGARNLLNAIIPRDAVQ